MNKNRKYLMISVFFCALIILFIYLIAFNQGGYSYGVPEQTDDGWITASLSDVGMDTEPIINLINDLSNENDDNIHSIVLIKNSKLIFEEYFSGEDLDLTNGITFSYKDFDRNTLHSQCSASKSITSILLGITIDQGFIQGIQEKMFSFFPEYSDLNNSTKNRITLEHMLSMSSGLPWDESYPYTDSRNNLNQMLYYVDPIRYVLEKSVVATPGSQFIYNSGTTNLLGDVVRRSTGLTLADFAEQHLFTLLGIKSFNWTRFPNAPNITIASSALYLLPRDMAKIGQLYLQKGIWNGNRIVSEDWVTESTHESIQVPTSQNPIPGFIKSYGYQWWRGAFSAGNTETYFAAGWGGQFIFVIPDLDMVIVITAGKFEGDYQGIYNLINDYILIAAGCTPTSPADNCCDPSITQLVFPNSVIIWNVELELPHERDNKSFCINVPNGANYLKILITDLQMNFDFFIYDNFENYTLGYFQWSSTNSNTNPENITIPSLTEGCYYMKILNTEGYGGSYTLLVDWGGKALLNR